MENPTLSEALSNSFIKSTVPYDSDIRSHSIPSILGNSISQKTWFSITKSQRVVLQTRTNEIVQVFMQPLCVVELSTRPPTRMTLEYNKYHTSPLNVSTATEKSAIFKCLAATSGIPHHQTTYVKVNSPFKVRPIVVMRFSTQHTMWHKAISYLNYVQFIVCKTFMNSNFI